MIEDYIDLDALIASLPMVKVGDDNKKPALEVMPTPTARIAVARDNAFCFYYQDNLDLLEKHGAELVFFSPITGDDLPGGVDGLYIGGGYPELFGDKLADNEQLRHHIKEKSMDGMPIYGECGGFMYLCEELCDPQGNGYPMTGCFPFTTRMFSRLKALGYREISLTRETVIGKRGLFIKGHEFHYSEITPPESEGECQTVYQITDRSGMNKPPDGYVVKNTLGSYNHLHFGSQPDAAAHFVKNCRVYRRQKEKQT
jgi:cobyrinic acid a,c-diamide synthase